MKEFPSPGFTPSPPLMAWDALHHSNGGLPSVAPPAVSEHLGIVVSWAKHQDEVRAAQRLRFDVFATEMGAKLRSPIPGHDMDFFDDYCEHLLVRDAATQQVIGTYRVLTPAHR